MASNNLPTCTYCYTRTTIASTLNLPAPPIPDMRPVLNNGSVQMMDSMVWDLAGIVIANNIDPEDQEAALGLGALAIILSKGRAIDDVAKAEVGIVKAEAQVAKTEASLFPKKTYAAARIFRVTFFINN